ncbi:MAG: MFS transporter, partial [Kangiellaceae bacterium]|nr:MFS transporter [Kangiellaceae bacterium]
MIAAIGGFLFGYDTGVIGGANQYIEDEMNLDPLTEETVVSIAILGAVFGAIAAGPCSDHFGRKKTILLADVVFFLGAIFMGLAPSVELLIGGRF